MCDIDQKVGLTQAHRVEFPGYISCIDRAIECLGGDEGLTKAASVSNRVLPLRLRPDCSDDRPIFGERCSQRGLLVKIKKSSGCMSAEIVARVVATYRFVGLADFHFCPDKSLQTKTTQDSAAFEDEMGKKEEPLLLLPPFFTRNDEPNDYQFRGYYGSDAPELRTTGAGRVRGHLAAHVAQWTDLAVPKPVDIVPAAFKAEKASMLEQLTTLFNVRPVWTSLDLRERIQGLGPHEIELASKHAYVFRSGPFARAWIKRGYDPRADASSGQFQTAHYVLPPKWAKLLTAKKIAAMDEETHLLHQKEADRVLSVEYSKLCRFEAAPKQAASLILGDLQQERISSLLQDSASFHDSCDKYSGWIKRPCWEEITGLVSHKFGDLLQSDAQLVKLLGLQSPDNEAHEDAANTADAPRLDEQAQEGANAADAWQPEGSMDPGADDFEIFEEDSADE